MAPMAPTVRLRLPVVIFWLLTCHLSAAARGRGTRCSPFPAAPGPSDPRPVVVTGRLLAFYPVFLPHVRFPVRRRGLVQVTRVLAGQVTRPQLVVDGFYKFGVCNSRLRLRDARIFFLEPPGQRRHPARYSRGNGTEVEADFLLISTARITEKNVKIAKSYSDHCTAAVTHWSRLDDG